MDSTGTILMPPGQSTFAGEVDALFYFIFWVGLIILVGVLTATLYFVFRYRQRGEDDPGLTSGPTHNTRLEILWSVIPTILVFFVFAWGFKTYLKMNIAPRDAMTVKATGQKWFWTFEYADGSTAVNELVVPVHHPVEVLLSSRDVIHSFYIPNFRVKMDVLPNRYTKLWFEATEAGTYDLFCAEYCGKGHSEMKAQVRVLGEPEYEKWQASSANLGEGLSLEEFGAELYASKACNACHSVDGSKMIGPSWKGTFGKEVRHTDGTTATSDENYLRESILDPQAHIIAGYAPVMPAFQGLLKDREIDALITYIKSLK